MAMKLQEKQNRRGDGANSMRFKRGACISEKQWARLDDPGREKAVKAGALPPYKAAKLKKKKGVVSHFQQRRDSFIAQTWNS
eukprot:Pgem_evm1s278